MSVPSLFILSNQTYFSCSHFWFATVQEVLHADWHDVWHSPHPPCAADSLKVQVFRVLM